MTILVAVPDSPEGRAALTAAATEAIRLETDVIAVNLGLVPLAKDAIPTMADITVLDRDGRDQRDPVDLVLRAIKEHSADLLVIGVKRRNPVSKAILGSVSQRLILESPVPVLAVKTEDE